MVRADRSMAKRRHSASRLFGMPGKPRLGQRQRVDHARQGQRRQAEARQLRIQEAEVERRVVRDQLAVAEELQQVVGELGEPRLAGHMAAQ